MKRRFGDAQVSLRRETIIDRRNGRPLLDKRGKPSTRPVGSRIVSKGYAFDVPQFPSRIKDVREHSTGVAVQFDGSTKMFDYKHDGQLLESAAGGSMGGHDPRKHGKIRYIVRSFGKWANGKHSGCVRVIRTKHPELLAGGRDVNALCAWLKDQWAGTTKWRSERKGAVTEAQLSEAGRRLVRGLPVDDLDFDAMVEQVRALTGIEPWAVCEELGVVAADPDDPWEALFEAECRHNAEALTANVSELREALAAQQMGRCADLLEEWLALHGDPGRVSEALYHPGVVERAVRRVGPSYPRNELDRRVMEAMVDGDVDFFQDVSSLPRQRRVDISDTELMTEARCKHCGCRVGKDRRTCPECGERLSESFEDLFDLIEEDADSKELANRIMGVRPTLPRIEQGRRGHQIRVGGDDGEG